MFNAGLWKSHGLDNTSLHEIRDALEDAGITGIYKTTTRDKTGHYYNPGSYEYEEIACQLFTCLNMSWTANLTKQDYSDHIHLQPHFNNHINKQLFTLLGIIL